jgi:hypothetical protein
MDIILQRQQQTDKCTFGKFIVGVRSWQSLEDIHRDVKIPGETRIPAGRYELKLRTQNSKMNNDYKRRFPGIHKGMIEICGIPNYGNVYIHIGNSDKDTMGCPLIGKARNTGQNMIYQSTIAYLEFYPIVCDMIEAGPTFIQVIDEVTR